MAKVNKELKKATGNMPVDDKGTFEDIVSKLIETWKITRPPEVMLVNRMVATWMKLRKVEEMLSKYDLFFEQRNNKGDLVGVTMNQLAYYLKSLEADFRNYYKTLQTSNNLTKDDTGPKDFHDFLETAKKVK